MTVILTQLIQFALQKDHPSRFLLIRVRLPYASVNLIKPNTQVRCAVVDDDFTFYFTFLHKHLSWWPNPNLKPQLISNIF